MARTIILVHGSFHTGACWFLLTPLLEALGFSVRTPTLRGQTGNPRAALLVSQKSYADDIIACAEAVGGRSVLLGHSLAGFAISAAAERRPELFERLIYLTAAVPKFGTSGLRDTMPKERPSGAGAMKLRLRLTPRLPPDSAIKFAYNCCSPEVQAQAVPLLSPQPIRPLLGKIRTTQARLGALPKHLIDCAQDRIMPPADQVRRRANLNFVSVDEMDCDHSPFLSRPGELAELIWRLTGDVGPAGAVG